MYSSKFKIGNINLLIITFMIIFSGCKKTSIEADYIDETFAERLEGTWKASHGQRSNVFSLNGWDDYDTVGLNYSNKSYGYLNSFDDYEVIQNDTIRNKYDDFSYTITFRKDGTCEWAIEYEIKDFGNESLLILNRKDVFEGVWNRPEKFDKPELRTIYISVEQHEIETIETINYFDGSPSVSTRENEEVEISDNDEWRAFKQVSANLVLDYESVSWLKYPAQEYNPNNGITEFKTIVEKNTEAGKFTFVKQ